MTESTITQEQGFFAKTGLPDSQSNLRYIVRVVDCAADSHSNLLGTAIVIAPKVFLTSYHVIKKFWEGFNPRFDDVRIQMEDGTDLGPITEVRPHPRHSGGLDLALLFVDNLVHIELPTFLCDIGSDLHERISRQQFQVFGYSNRTGGLVLSIANVWMCDYDKRGERWLLGEVQITGGAKEGNSGGPVLVEKSGKVACIGLVYLGGTPGTTSRLMSTEIILDFIESSLSSRPDDVVKAETFFPSIEAQVAQSKLQSKPGKRPLKWLLFSCVPLLALSILGWGRLHRSVLDEYDTNSSLPDTKLPEEKSVVTNLQDLAPFPHPEPKQQKILVKVDIEAEEGEKVTFAGQTTTAKLYRDTSTGDIIHDTSRATFNLYVTPGKHRAKCRRPGMASAVLFTKPIDVKPTEYRYEAKCPQL